jgi:predicted nucleotidyltransferase
MPTRAELVQHLRQVLPTFEGARGAWLGGSDATGRTDALSDVDLVVVARDEDVRPVFERIERDLDAFSGIDLKLELPRPTWHGHDQTFFRLKSTPPECFIDLVVMTQSAPEHTRFLEPERHGKAEILFDLDGWIRPARFDRDAHLQKMRSKFEFLKLRVAMFQPLITKALARGIPEEAAYFYVTMCLTQVVEALRMLHCPDRYDYGFRYLKDDLPPAARETVQRLCFYGSPDALALRHREAVALFASTAREIEARYGW